MVCPVIARVNYELVIRFRFSGAGRAAHIAAAVQHHRRQHHARLPGHGGAARARAHYDAGRHGGGKHRHR